TAGTKDGARVSGGTTTGSETKATSCGGLAGTTAHNIALTSNWTVKTGTPLNPSKGALTSVTTTVNNSTGAITFDSIGKVKTGSFSAAPLNDIKAHALIKENFSAVATQCGGAGVSVLHIKPASTFSIT